MQHHSTSILYRVCRTHGRPVRASLLVFIVRRQHMNNHPLLPLRSNCVMRHLWYSYIMYNRVVYRTVLTGHKVVTGSDSFLSNTKNACDLSAQQFPYWSCSDLSTLTWGIFYDRIIILHWNARSFDSNYWNFNSQYNLISTTFRLIINLSVAQKAFVIARKISMHAKIYARSWMFNTRLGARNPILGSEFGVARFRCFFFAYACNLVPFKTYYLYIVEQSVDQFQRNLLLEGGFW